MGNYFCRSQAPQAVSFELTAQSFKPLRGLGGEAWAHAHASPEAPERGLSDGLRPSAAAFSRRLSGHKPRTH